MASSFRHTQDPWSRRRKAGIVCALAGLLWLSTAGGARGEAEPVESYGSLPDLVGAADAIVVGTSLGTDQGPKLGPTGWQEGVWANVMVEAVVWSRQLVPSEIVLDGLSAESDVPPVGERAVLVLRQEVEAPAPHYRLVVPSSMVLLRPAGSVITSHAPEYLLPLADLPAPAVIDRLGSLTPATEGLRTDHAVSPLLVGLIGLSVVAVAVFSGLPFRRHSSR